MLGGTLAIAAVGQTEVLPAALAFDLEEDPPRGHVTRTTALWSTRLRALAISCLKMKCRGARSMGGMPSLHDQGLGWRPTDAQFSGESWMSRMPTT